MTAVDSERTVAEQPFSWKFTAPLLIGSTFNPINSSLLATGLAGIGAEFGVDAGRTASLVSVLYLCSAVAQPTMGKLSTVFGPRRVYLGGVMLLIVGGAIGTFAPAIGYLSLSRALIGIGTSACYPTAMALIRKRADDNRVGVPSRVLGNFSIAAQVTTVVGLPLGGLLAGEFGWRALFAVNLPLALLSIVWTFLSVEKDAPISGRSGQLWHAVDVPGIVLFAGGITALLTFLSHVDMPVWWLLGVCVVLLVGLVLRERSTDSPLIDVRMLGSNGPLVRTYCRQVLLYLGSYTVLYGLSQWMEEARGLSASQVGLILLPMSLVSIAMARFVSNHGWIRRPLTFSGFALTAAAVMMLVLTDTSPIIALLGVTVLIGLMQGTSGFANQASLYLQAPAPQIAVASGLLRTSTYLGAIFSSSLISVTFDAVPTDGGLHALAGVLAIIGAGVTVFILLDRRIPAMAAATA